MIINEHHTYRLFESILKFDQLFLLEFFYILEREHQSLLSEKLKLRKYQQRLRFLKTAGIGLLSSGLALCFGVPGHGGFLFVVSTYMTFVALIQGMMYQPTFIDRIWILAELVSQSSEHNICADLAPLKEAIKQREQDERAHLQRRLSSRLAGSTVSAKSGIPVPLRVQSMT